MAAVDLGCRVHIISDSGEALWTADYSAMLSRVDKMSVVSGGILMRRLGAQIGYDEFEESMYLLIDDHGVVQPDHSCAMAIKEMENRHWDFDRDSLLGQLSEDRTWQFYWPPAGAGHDASISASRVRQKSDEEMAKEVADLNMPEFKLTPSPLASVGKSWIYERKEKIRDGALAPRCLLVALLTSRHLLLVDRRGHEVWKRPKRVRGGTVVGFVKSEHFLLVGTTKGAEVLSLEGESLFRDRSLGRVGKPLHSHDGTEVFLPSSRGVACFSWT